MDELGGASGDEPKTVGRRSFVSASVLGMALAGVGLVADQSRAQAEVWIPIEDRPACQA